MEYLIGHTSPETAYVVDNYPYGFRLRCKIRYWLEYKPGKGFRFVSQTTNPKRPGETWNKPKPSTYHHGAAAMYIDEDTGHVSWTAVNFSEGFDRLSKIPPEMVETMPTAAQAELARYIEISRRYEELKAGGMNYLEAARQAVVDDAKTRVE